MKTRVMKPTKNSGFTLVEALIGMAIGLIVMLIIMQVFSVAEGYRRTTTAGTDAQTNGILALRTLESEVRMAGYGLTSAGAYICPQINSYYNNQCSTNTAITCPMGTWDAVNKVCTVTTQPLIITDGGAASDTIDILYSASQTGYSPIAITDVPATSSNVTKVNSTDGLNVCDIVLYASRDGSKQCTLMQVTGLPNNGIQFTTASGQNNSCYNPNGGLNDTIYPAQGWSTNDVIINLGSRIYRRYAVFKTTNADEYFLRRTNMNPSNGCSTPDPNPNLDMISNIVAIKAQYGVAPANSQSVDCWTDAIDQSANAALPTHCRVNWITSTTHQVAATDARRIKAVRIAIVARSNLAERPSTAGGSCDTTSTAPISWDGGPTIDLTSDPNWKCYRYKVYQSVIPLINVIWANT